MAWASILRDPVVIMTALVALLGVIAAYADLLGTPVGQGVAAFFCAVAGLLIMRAAFRSATARIVGDKTTMAVVASLLAGACFAVHGLIGGHMEPPKVAGVTGSVQPPDRDPAREAEKKAKKDKPAPEPLRDTIRANGSAPEKETPAQAAPTSTPTPSPTPVATAAGAMRRTRRKSTTVKKGRDGSVVRKHLEEETEEVFPGPTATASPTPTPDPTPSPDPQPEPTPVATATATPAGEAAP